MKKDYIVVPMNIKTKIIKSFKIFVLRILVTTIFATVCALLFQFVESPHPHYELKNKEELRKVKLSIMRDTLDKVNSDGELNITFKYFESIVSRIDEMNRKTRNIEQSRTGWSMLKSFYLTFTVVTTVGYGDVIPRTKAGMWLVIFTGFLGIPITLLSLQTLGELIHSVIIGLCELVEVKLMKRSVVTKKDSKALLVTFILMLLIMIFGTLCENYENDWSWTQGFYAWFVALSTIGFGDTVVFKSLFSGSDNEKSVALAIFYITYLILGLGVVASIIHAVQAFLQSNRQFKRFFAVCFGITVSSEQKRKILRATIEAFKSNVKRNGMLTSDIRKYANRKYKINATDTLVESSSNELAMEDINKEFTLDEPSKKGSKIEPCPPAINNHSLKAHSEV